MTHHEHNRRTQHVPEVMSPAGYWPQLQAAIEAGADAVYFGLTHFTARAKVGFVLEELPDVMRTLHARGVRGFLTFNTLIFGHELATASQALAAIAAAGTDAVIVQDIGVARLAKQIAPAMEVHGSTQMSITSAAGVEFARTLGVDRVVLARELSLAEIRRIREQTDTELEVFVHGALCVSYSGQCFSSEAWGGRSANRGQCAQACRLPYDLIVDGTQKPIGDARYVLSPGDLMALDHVPELVDIGVASLKIEGRYKDAEYVALTTRAYREAVDAALQHQQRSADAVAADKQLLEQVYSRGLGDYFIGGTNHQTVVRGRAPRHRGVHVGHVVAVAGGRVTIEPTVIDLKRGDGLVFDAADWRSPEEPEEGGRIYDIASTSPHHLTLTFGRDAINVQRIRPGDWVWRTDDPDIAKHAKPYLSAPQPLHRQWLDIEVTSQPDQPVRVQWRVRNHPQAVVTTSIERLADAEARAVPYEVLCEKLGRLGGTAYRLGELHVHGSAPVAVPMSQLNQVRRDAIAQISAMQAQLPQRDIASVDTVLQQALSSVLRTADTAAVDPTVQLHVLVRQPDQLAAAIAARPHSITLDYLEFYGLKDAVTQVRDAGIAVQVASPRIIKPGEERIVDFLVRLDCPILVRGAGVLHDIATQARHPLIGDFSLNAANVLSAQLLQSAGIARVTPTHDCNAAQIQTLLQHLGSEAIEVIAYHHLPVFHTEHCVFCRFLSNGTSYKDCGRPCEQHQIGLRDHTGRIHPVIADVGCRNTVFGAQAQEGSKHMAEWLQHGLRHVRIEFAHEDAQQVQQVIRSFRQGLSGHSSWTDVGRQLRAVAPMGTTEGSFFVPDQHTVIPLI